MLRRTFTSDFGPQPQDGQYILDQALALGAVSARYHTLCSNPLDMSA